MIDVNLQTEIASVLEKAVDALVEAGQIAPGGLIVLGCSTSEVAGARIGKGSVPELGEVIAAAMLEACRKRGLNAVRAESSGGDVEAVASVAVHQEEEPVTEAPAPEEGMPEKEDEPHLFETLSVEETNEESGEALPPVSEEAPAAPEQRVDEGRHGGTEEALADEPVEEPVVKVLRLLDELEAALTCLDSPAIRRDCAALAAHAEAHGMRHGPWRGFGVGRGRRGSGGADRGRHARGSGPDVAVLCSPKRRRSGLCGCFCRGATCKSRGKFL